MKKEKIFLEFKKSIKNKKSTISVIGLGYIGLPLSLAFIKAGFKVVGIDKDIKKINIINSNKSYISTVSDNQIKISKKRNFIVSNKFSLISKSNIIIVCVPTPINKNKKPVMDHIASVVAEIKKYLVKNQLFILECTTYPGTSEDYFLPIFKEKKLEVGKNIFLGYSPEREDPGNLKYSIIRGNLSKVVSGYTDSCETLVKELYGTVIKNVHPVSNIRTAEFTKLLENIYRSVNVGLVNELYKICSKMNINIYEAINAASTKPFGYKPFFPGPGVGGHCIPIDPYFLSWKAKQLGLTAKFIDLAGKINDRRPYEIVKKIKKYFKERTNSINRKKILILGVAYKKNSDDAREAPAIKICNLLKLNFKDKIIICDPFVENSIDNNFKKYKFVKIKKLKNKNFLKSLKLCVVVTNHDIFDYNFISKNTKVIFDCRNSFKKDAGNIIKV